MPARIYSPRLKNFDYQGPRAAHLVFVTRERDELFTDGENAGICLKALEDASTALAATIHAYCIMPNHVHALVESEKASALLYAKRFKQLSGYRLKQLVGSEVWQISYYDHILRSDEDVLDVARYIWENPVEDGLVPDYLDYQFSGPRGVMTSLPTH